MTEWNQPVFSDAQLNALYRYGLSLTNDETLSYDLLREALEAYLKLDAEQRPVDGAEVHLRMAMRNRYLDQLRKEKRYPLESVEDGGDRLISMAMPDPGVLAIERKMLEPILNRLNPMERELLHLWAYEEFTAREIGRQLDAPPGTILSRIHQLERKITQLGLDSTGTGKGTGA
jgi:RNA polymerase sigma factor (sigma-70 family)